MENIAAIPFLRNNAPTQQPIKHRRDSLRSVTTPLKPASASTRHQTDNAHNSTGLNPQLPGQRKTDISTLVSEHQRRPLATSGQYPRLYRSRASSVCITSAHTSPGRFRSPLRASPSNVVVKSKPFSRTSSLPVCRSVQYDTVDACTSPSTFPLTLVEEAHPVINTGSIHSEETCEPCAEGKSCSPPSLATEKPTTDNGDAHRPHIPLFPGGPRTAGQTPLPSDDSGAQGQSATPSMPSAQAGGARTTRRNSIRSTSGGHRTHSTSSQRAQNPFPGAKRVEDDAVPISTKLMIGAGVVAGTATLACVLFALIRGELMASSRRAMTVETPCHSGTVTSVKKAIGTGKTPTTDSAAFQLMTVQEIRDRVIRNMKLYGIPQSSVAPAT